MPFGLPQGGFDLENKWRRKSLHPSAGIYRTGRPPNEDYLYIAFLIKNLKARAAERLTLSTNTLTDLGYE
jgi:hypothetical protein